MEQSGEGQLVVVATPIGNLGDLSPRALQVLTNADVVYCEDTRRSRTLFSAHGLSPKSPLQSLHEHNEAERCAQVIERVRAGQLVALVSDAGTPGISDPGERVVAAVAQAGLTVTGVPGPSAVVAALSISGLASERFVMEGFLPRKGSERQRRVESWDLEARTVVFYESPQRLGATLAELAARWPTRAAVVARELTKLHEETARGTLSELAARYGHQEPQGEIVVVLAGVVVSRAVDDDEIQRALARAFEEGASTRDAVDEVAAALGVARRHVYQLALERTDDED
ncbi:MAG: 16S rRNA (cytidine(1402)-2'-O)-methyltransferase [Acidobacteriota bacterium]|nr:16S rRNA (cytidine(1402)-2'-O)-methyltransferase [Acidobacteriota bacterium]MDE3222529.1 16S rRNA (cytidine(1402)-2'-O)-methyltransferase [Acidobacteriota bacterium]